MKTRPNHATRIGTASPARASARWRIRRLGLGLIAVLCAAFIAVEKAGAGFAGEFSLSAAEEYNDNIFFSRNKQHDFITSITPTFTLLYTPPAGTSPTLRASLAPSGQIFARHGELNNFGENISFNSGYTYPYSPRLTFNLSDSLQRSGETRVSLAGEEMSAITPFPTVPRPPGGTEPPPVSQQLGDFLSTGDTLTNYFSAQASYLYAPDITLSGGYSFGYTDFIDRGGSETSHVVGARGVYHWRQQHNLHAGYAFNIIKSRDGDDNVVHNFDIGDDFFSTTLVQLTPTLTLSVSTGLSFNAGNEGPRVVNNTDLTIVKRWETAALSAGMTKGLTGSFGVSGPSDTTTFFTGLDMRFSERLRGITSVDFSLFDTDDVNFKTFRAHVGVQYSITHWLCSNLGYNHRWVDGGSGATANEFLNRGKVHSNSAFLVFSAHFDVWPSISLAKRAVCPTTSPYVAQPPSL